jgi:hypothetical protein
MVQHSSHYRHLHAVQKRHDNSKTLQLLADELIQHENLKEINMQVIMGKTLHI